MITGYRAWLLKETREGWRLSSLVLPSVWRRENLAACKNNLAPHAIRTDWRLAVSNCSWHILKKVCNCGYQSYNNPEEFLMHSSVFSNIFHLVAGRIAHYGNVARCDHGYRSARAKVLELFVPDKFGEIAIAQNPPIPWSSDLATLRLLQATSQFDIRQERPEEIFRQLKEFYGCELIYTKEDRNGS